MNSQQYLFFDSLFRILQTAARAALTASLLSAAAFAQNPVPEVVGPVHPQAVVPGSGAFTLNVYGANFVPGAVVNWNRQARSTTFISARELQAQILASDVVAATAGYITVTNPPPGGGISSSSWSLVEVHTPTATIVPDAPTRYLFSGSNVPSLLVADFNNDGIPDLAAGLGGRISVSLGNGDATFRFASNATYVSYGGLFGVSSVAYGDFNGDGNLDLAFAADFQPKVPSTGLGVSLGNGDGTFDPGWQYIDTDNDTLNIVVGDFNRDGKLDIMGGNCCDSSVFLGNGDGTFRPFASYPAASYERFVGDFNGDGILDVAVLGDATTNATIFLALGNGDGTFQKLTPITKVGGGCFFGPSMLVSDFNGDGNLDLAYCTDSSIGILLGNGDGTFQKPILYYVGTAGEFSFAAGDFNSDGNTDLIVSHYNTGQFLILLGNGDGTFQPKSEIKLPGPPNQGGELGIVTGDFNSDGLLDFIFQLPAIGMGVYVQQ